MQLKHVILPNSFGTIYYFDGWDWPSRKKWQKLGFAYHPKLDPGQRCVIGRGCYSCKIGLSNHVYTVDDDIAARAIDYADEDTVNLLDKRRKMKSVKLMLSTSLEADLKVPAPKDLNYLPFQLAGIKYCLMGDTLLADDMGLGKTIQCIGVINAARYIKRVLVICPAHLKLNWAIEFETWLTRNLTFGVANSKEWPDTNIVIINYDIIHTFHDEIRKYMWDLFIADECHYLKNRNSRRSVYVYGGIYASKARDKKDNTVVSPIPKRKAIFTTGTPLDIKPDDVFAIAHYLDEFGYDWRKIDNFRKRYYKEEIEGVYRRVKGKVVYEAKGKVYTTPKNLDLLQQKMRQVFMIRREKSEVDVQLPSRQIQLIELPPEGLGSLLDETKQLYLDWQEKTALHHKATTEKTAREKLIKLSDEIKETKHEIDRKRQAIGLMKVPYAYAHVKDAMRNGKVVLFTYHRAVAKELFAKLEHHKKGCARLHIGGMGEKKRNEAYQEFRKDPDVLVFVATMNSAGEGLNLVESAHTVFAEPTWVPKTMAQAGDRIVRMGQQAASVLEQYLVFKDSIDLLILGEVAHRRNMADKALRWEELPPEVQAAALLQFSSEEEDSEEEDPKIPDHPGPDNLEEDNEKQTSLF